MTMDLLALMDNVKAKALVVTTAIDSSFTDVAVGFPASKGRCVRIFYGGERQPARFPDAETFASVLVSQAVVVRGYWPTASTATSEQRVIEGQMASFLKGMRTALYADQDLGGAGEDGLKTTYGVADQIVVSNTQYAVIDFEIVVDYDEHTQAR